MWYAPDKYKRKLVNLNDEYIHLKGELTDRDAKVTLAKFLRHNVGFTVELLTGIKLAPYQEVTLKAFLNRNYSMCVWGRGAGKTILNSDLHMLIEKTKGLISTKQICERIDFSKGERWVDIPELELWNGDSWQKTTKLLVQPKKQCNKITTNYGYFLEGSINHKIKVLDIENCKIVWKRYHELKENDCVCISKQNVHTDIKFDNDAYLAVIKRHRKEIPKRILSSGSSLKSFLQGLFDLNGDIEFSKNTGSISYRSSSEKLIKQIHIALLTFGIISKIKNKRTKSNPCKAYAIDIKNEEALIFFERIGFKLTRKQKFYENFKRIDFNTDVNENFLKIQKENFFFDRIEKIENSEQDCIDFNIPEGARYWSNGFISHNSFIAAIFCIFQTIFEPNTKIIIAGPTFRTARNIFTEIEKINKFKEASFLAQAFNIEAPSHKNDLYQWLINGGSITAIPLNGEKIRGFRANVIILDEYLLLSESMIKNVLMPFLVAPQNIGERLKIREVEDQLIKAGKMEEFDRIEFSNSSKMIALSSASFSFEYLYQNYQEWLGKIYDGTDSTSKYFVSQVGFQGIPSDMVEKTVIEEASAGGLENPGFLREYCAQFTDGNQGYFSAKKMNECTIPDGAEPHLRLVGDPKKKYILAIDPSFSKSPSADNFAMCVLELDEEKKYSTVVHNYARAGGDLINHINYFYYLTSCFNIVFIISDNADGNFIESCNETKLFRDNKVQFRFLDNWEVGLVDEKRQMMMNNTKKEYNLFEKKICIKHLFNSNSIREMNECLQGCIDFKRVWFGSRMRPTGFIFDKIISAGAPTELVSTDEKYSKMEILGDMIDNQDNLINQLKKECALIEVRSTTQGNQTFDLPQHLKRERSEKRARRDSYTALMLGTWATKTYFDIISYNPPKVQSGFEPIFIK